MKKPISKKKKPLLTLIATAKPFLGEYKIIQRNAISSWVALRPLIDIIMVGNETGVENICKEFNIKHIKNVRHSSSGAPYLNSIFDILKINAKSPLIGYINSDIILLPDIIPSLKEIINNYSRVLMIGRRTDLDVKKIIRFKDPKYSLKLKQQVKRMGRIHSVYGLDYFIFTHSTYKKIPDLLIARGAWDNWLVMNCLKRSIPVINCTSSITAIHQNHTLGSMPGQHKNKDFIKEVKYNKNLVKGRFSSTEDSTFFMFNNTVFPTPKIFRKTLFYIRDIKNITTDIRKRMILQLKILNKLIK